MEAAETRWIRTKGFPPSFALAVALVAVMFAAGIAITILLQAGGKPVLPFNTQLGAFALLAFLAGVILFVTWIQTPRAVGLTTTGIVLQFTHERVLLPWHELMNVLYVTGTVLVFRPLSTPTKLGGWFQVTLPQARGILGDSRCPPVTLREDQRKAIFSQELWTPS